MEERIKIRRSEKELEEVNQRDQKRYIGSVMNGMIKIDRWELKRWGGVSRGNQKGDQKRYIKRGNFIERI